MAETRDWRLPLEERGRRRPRVYPPTLNWFGRKLVELIARADDKLQRQETGSREEQGMSFLKHIVIRLVVAVGVGMTFNLVTDLFDIHLTLLETVLLAVLLAIVVIIPLCNSVFGKPK